MLETQTVNSVFHMILFPKVENIVTIHFFAQNTEALIEF